MISDVTPKVTAFGT